MKITVYSSKSSEKEGDTSLPEHLSLLKHTYYPRKRYIVMIRVFEIFCKLKDLLFSAAALYNKEMQNLKLNDHICPYCKTRKPNWKKHATYERYLISYCQDGVLYESIIVFRYRCSSCNHTHAILPELIVPYNSYSLIFIIYVMKDYYSGSYTVRTICDKYKIAISTLYSWKKLYLKHKRIWLGILQDSNIEPQLFLTSILNGNQLHKLKDFFELTGISFIQYTPIKSRLNSG